MASPFPTVAAVAAVAVAVAAAVAANNLRPVISAPDETAKLTALFLNSTLHEKVGGNDGNLFRQPPLHPFQHSHY
jgi:hypothetical protein